MFISSWYGGNCYNMHSTCFFSTLIFILDPRCSNGGEAGRHQELYGIALGWLCCCLPLVIGRSHVQSTAERSMHRLLHAQRSVHKRCARIIRLINANPLSSSRGATMRGSFGCGCGAELFADRWPCSQRLSFSSWLVPKAQGTWCFTQYYVVNVDVKCLLWCISNTPVLTQLLYTTILFK